MLHHVRRLFRDERGTSFEGIALSVSIIAVGFIASADVLDYMTRKHGPEINTTVRDVASAIMPTDASSGIDYTVTGSMPGASKQPIILDPCTGKMK